MVFANAALTTGAGTSFGDAGVDVIALATGAAAADFFVLAFADDATDTVTLGSLGQDIAARLSDNSFEIGQSVWTGIGSPPNCV